MPQRGNYASIWKGWPRLSYSARWFTGNSAELYEAAKIDGASAWQQFKMVTLPMLAPVSKTLLLLNVIWNFHAYNQFYILLGGSVGEAHVPSTFIMQEAFTNLHYGLGSAMSVVLVLIVILLISILLAKRRAGYES